MRRLLPLSLCGLAALLGCAGAQSTHPAGPTNAEAVAPGQTGAETSRTSFAADLVEQAARTLRELRKSTGARILDEAIVSARAVIVLPGVYQAGFLYSIHGGNGVLIARRADGGWGAPVFVTVAGAGYGLQAGLEKSRLVLAVQEEEMLTSILENGLSFDATTKYDILGVREQTGPDSLTTERPVQAFSDGVGVMAGMALRGGMLSVNRELTRAYHGTQAAQVEELMREISAPGLETFELWAALGVAPAAPAQAGGIIRPGRP